METQTYYILSKKGAAEGDGSYLGLTPQGNQGLVAGHVQARRFAVLEEAEQAVIELRDSLGDFNIEVRNAAA